MASDYLESKFPPYVLTEDTSVIRFKEYFRKIGSKFQKIPNIDATVNPRSQGWYQFKSNHNEEFRFNVESHQVNNVNMVCDLMLNRLLEFPVKTLDRTRQVDEFTIDWTGLLSDTKWSETIGSFIVPPYCIPFSTNLYIAKHLNEYIDLYTSNGSTIDKLTTWETMRTAIEGFATAMTATCTGKTYSEWVTTSFGKLSVMSTELRMCIL